MAVRPCLWVLAGCWSLGAMTGRAAAQNEGMLPAAPAETVTAFVQILGGRLSVRAENESLGGLLSLVARRTKLAITVAPEIDADHASFAFADVPLEEGLRRIVGAYDAFLFYAGAPAEPVLTALWVFPRGQGQALAPLDAVIWASDADVEKRLTDPDSDIRLRALGALIERRGEKAMDAVLAELADPDEAMRAQVLDLAFGSGLQIPPDRWSALALTDPSALIRLQALQLAPACTELATVAQAARHDPDPYVQLEARAILARLAEASAPDSGAERPLPP